MSIEEGNQMTPKTSFTKEQTEYILESKRRLVTAFQQVLDAKQYNPDGLDDAKDEFESVVKDVAEHDETNSPFLTQLISGFTSVINGERS